MKRRPTLPLSPSPSFSKADASVFLTVTHLPFGAFSATPESATATLRFLAGPSSSRSRKNLRPSLRGAWSSPPDSPVDSESFSESIPSISRTASSFSVSDIGSPSSSAATSLLDFSILPERTPRKRATINVDVDVDPRGDTQCSDIDPRLALLEKRSRFCTARVFCVTCQKPGTNYPSCARCGDKWCSRACRLDGAARHVCRASTGDSTDASSTPTPRKMTRTITL
ncbi:hypothetical protein C8J57DRAFT_1279945 [Mycena rebaudengoi]|nr:hypothetical protein C8J57DRAFT_1279945 [Mycena rebaudengoi]